MRKVCFVVNPFAGLGGPLARKGTDKHVIEMAVKKGLRLVALDKAMRFLNRLRSLSLLGRLYFLTAHGKMGSEELEAISASYTVVYKPRSWPTTALDTINTIRACLGHGAELVVFVGGDGTARDVMSVVKDEEVPILGVPAGVKMFSSLFAVSPERAAMALLEWVEGKASPCRLEVVDYDEEAYRRGFLRLIFHGMVMGICGAHVVGSSKQVIGGDDVEENRRAVARYFVESMEECTLYVLGPGGTIKAIADEIGIDKTLLGIDVVHNNKLIAKDVNEEELYRLVKAHIERGGRVKIVVTPIGGQGFILGRGNQPISPRILRLLGRNSIVVVADRYKLAGLKSLRVDTGDPEVDDMLRGYMRVIVDYGEEVVMRIE
ncbi:MAG: ATP-NAD kinase family protein [Pyrodictiaceae archaeon]